MQCFRSRQQSQRRARPLSYLGGGRRDRDRHIRSEVSKTSRFDPVNERHIDASRRQVTASIHATTSPAAPTSAGPSTELLVLTPIKAGPRKRSRKAHRAEVITSSPYKKQRQQEAHKERTQRARKEAPKRKKRQDVPIDERQLGTSAEETSCLVCGMLFSRSSEQWIRVHVPSAGAGRVYLVPTLTRSRPPTCATCAVSLCCWLGKYVQRTTVTSRVCSDPVISDQIICAKI